MILVPFSSVKNLAAIELFTQIIKGMAKIKYSLFSNFIPENKAFLAEHFSAKHNIEYCDAFNVLYAINPVLEYSYPGFNHLEIAENSSAVFALAWIKLRM